MALDLNDIGDTRDADHELENGNRVMARWQDAAAAGEDIGERGSQMSLYRPPSLLTAACDEQLGADGTRRLSVEVKPMCFHRFRRRPGYAILLATMLAGPASRSHAGFIAFTDQDAWFNAVGRVTTIDFTGFPVGTLITDQYADLGVFFTGGSETIRFNKDSFPPDQFGLQALPLMRLEFTSPQAWIAVSFPGFLRFELSFERQLIYTSPNFGGVGPGHFAGLLGDQLFDTVVIRDPDLDVNIGDLYFGVPAPSTLGALAIACAVGLGSRRRRSVSFRK